MKKCYKLDNQQETLIKGSSETTRRTTFNLDLLYWFVGFWEGDGALFNSQGRNFFVIVQNELVVLYKIKSFLKCGRVQKHGKYFRFIITKQNDILNILNLISNLIIFYKTFCKLRLILTALDEKVEFVNFNFFENGWLSGFIDAEGCFYIRLLKRDNYKLGYQLRLIFILDQKLDNDFDCAIFKNLALQLGGYIVIRNNKSYLRLFVENDQSIQKLINYLSRYPLRSQKKSIQYKHWLKVLHIKRKDCITDQDLLKIKKIKSWRYSPPKYESI